MVGGTGAKIALVCGYYGASSATLLLSATFILPLIIFGLIGVAIGHYMNSPGARGEELKEKIGDVVGNMTFQDISNPAGQRWGSSMWKKVKQYTTDATCSNPCRQDAATHSP